MASGIGNLVAEGNKSHIMNVFWQLSSAKYLTAGILVFSLSFLINPFIGWWLGEDYQLNKLIVILFMINLFIMQTRPIVDMFNHSFGLYGDVWAAWTEGIINIAVTIAIASQWGLIGILLGKIVSLFFIVILWKPYYLFSSGFHKSVLEFWRGMAPYYVIFFAFVAVSVLLRYLVVEPFATTLPLLVGCALLIAPALLVAYFLFLFYVTRGMKYFVARKPAVYHFLSFTSKTDSKS
jgi:hypothetical protein